MVVIRSFFLYFCWISHRLAINNYSSKLDTYLETHSIKILNEFIYRNNNAKEHISALLKLCYDLLKEEPAPSNHNIPEHMVLKQKLDNILKLMTSANFKFRNFSNSKNFRKSLLACFDIFKEDPITHCCLEYCYDSQIENINQHFLFSVNRILIIYVMEYFNKDETIDSGIALFRELVKNVITGTSINILHLFIEPSNNQKPLFGNAYKYVEKDIQRLLNYVSFYKHKIIYLKNRANYQINMVNNRNKNNQDSFYLAPNHEIMMQKTIAATKPMNAFKNLMIELFIEKHCFRFTYLNISFPCHEYDIINYSPFHFGFLLKESFWYKHNSHQESEIRSKFDLFEYSKLRYQDDYQSIIERIKMVSPFINKNDRHSHPLLIDDLFNDICAKFKQYLENQTDLRNIDNKSVNEFIPEKNSKYLSNTNNRVFISEFLKFCLSAFLFFSKVTYLSFYEKDVVALSISIFDCVRFRNLIDIRDGLFSVIISRRKFIINPFNCYEDKRKVMEEFIAQYPKNHKDLHPWQDKTRNCDHFKSCDTLRNK